MWLEAVERVLERVDVSVAGVATDPEAALRLIDTHEPDVLLTELVVRGDEADTVRFMERALERVPGLKIIVLSAEDDAESVRMALGAGAVAYVLKTAHPDDLASAIRQAFDHSVYLAAGSLLSLVRGRSANDVLVTLTPRELEILALVGEGYSNAKIAKTLWLAEQTVKFHLSNVFRKLGVSNRTEASRWAQLHGLHPARSAEQAS
jgi:DNA-binding NarL/FixJ family response regulator